HLRRRLGLVAWAERTRARGPRYVPPREVRGPAHALGRDDDPAAHDRVLAQLGHGLQVGMRGGVSAPDGVARSCPPPPPPPPPAPRRRAAAGGGNAPPPPPGGLAPLGRVDRMPGREVREDAIVGHAVAARGSRTISRSVRGSSACSRTWSTVSTNTKRRAS